MRWSDLRDGSGAHGRLGTLTTLALRAVLLALALQGTVFAQSRTAGTGSITGTARDASGLVLPGATIAAKNLRTGETADATSNAQGGYLFAALNPSTYTVTARLTGFAPVEFKDVQLLAGQEVRLDAESFQQAQQSQADGAEGENPEETSHDRRGADADRVSPLSAAPVPAVGLPRPRRDQGVLCKQSHAGPGHAGAARQTAVWQFGHQREW